MNNVTSDGRVILADVVYVPASAAEVERFRVREGDLLFNTRNSAELVGKVGYVGIMVPNLVYNNNLMRLRFPAGVSPAFVCHAMCSAGFRQRMELVKKATTNVAAVYAKDLFPLALPLPPLAEQAEIVAAVDRRLSVADAAETQVEHTLQRASRLRQAILRRAFEGKLVPQDPSDEPAAKLLERIRGRQTTAATPSSLRKRRPRRGVTAAAGLFGNT
jgi:type I restriction enzyme S subunit